MNGFIPRTILFLIIMIIFVAIHVLKLNIILSIYGLLGLGWLFFTGLANDIVERVSCTTEKSKFSHSDKNDLVSFNDAVSEEIMRIRSDLTNIKIKQDNLGWHKISNEFLQMFMTFKTYPSSFLCESLQPPDDCDSPDRYQGKIIIVLDGSINIDDYYDVTYDCETLRKLNTSKWHELKKGMAFTVFICEDKDDYSTFSRNAKILSIEEDSLGEDYFVYLEINLKTVLDDLYPTIDDKEEYGKIIRKIRISNRENYHFMCDKNEG